MRVHRVGFLNNDFTNIILNTRNIVTGKAAALVFLLCFTISVQGEKPQELDSHEMAAYFSLVNSFITSFYFTPHSEDFGRPSLISSIKKPTRQDFGYDKLEIVDFDVENNKLRIHYSLEGQDMGELDFAIEQFVWDLNHDDHPRLRLIFSEVNSEHLSAIGVFVIRQDQKIVYNLTVDLNSQILYLEQKYHASQVYQWNPLPVSKLDGTIKFKTMSRQNPSRGIRRKSCQFHLLY